MLKFAKLFLIALVLASCSNEPEVKPTTPLVIKTVNGDIRFMVEVANTPEALKTGLMHRTNLGFNSGMIFNIYPVRPTAMWMKNTKIPLDMIFVAPDATVSMIKENAEPMSEELIISRDPVRAVIELNAGQVKRHGIKVGDHINHMLLNNMVDVKTPGPEAEITAHPTQPAASKADIPVPSINIGPKAPAANAPQTPAQESAAATAAAQPNIPVVSPSAPQAAAPAPKLPVPVPSL